MLKEKSKKKSLWQDIEEVQPLKKALSPLRDFKDAFSGIAVVRNPASKSSYTWSSKALTKKKKKKVLKSKTSATMITVIPVSGATKNDEITPLSKIIFTNLQRNTRLVWNKNGHFLAHRVASHITNTESWSLGLPTYEQFHCYTQDFGCHTPQNFSDTYY